MTNEMMNLRRSGEEPGRGFVSRDMTSFAARRVTELEAGALTGAAHGEASVDRLVRRNG
ncbi:MAG: hypothetical protein ACRECP_02450 [Methylocella sp.]